MLPLTKEQIKEQVATAFRKYTTVEEIGLDNTSIIIRLGQKAGEDGKDIEQAVKDAIEKMDRCLHHMNKATKREYCIAMFKQNFTVETAVQAEAIRYQVKHQDLLSGSKVGIVPCASGRYEVMVEAKTKTAITWLNGFCTALLHHC